MEGEDEQTISRQLSLFQERVLPDLDSNIKCGNSLIGPDFCEGQQKRLFDEEEMYRINVFDWEKEFPEIMKNGGFDAVIGNPPYIRIQAMKEWAPREVEFYKQCYSSAGKGARGNQTSQTGLYESIFQIAVCLFDQRVGSVPGCIV